MKTECYLINDLLPLYHDDVCSEETKRAVAEHLEECAECRAEYGRLCGSDSVAENVFDEEQSERLAESLKAVKRRNLKRFIAVAAVSLVVSALLIGGIVFGVNLYRTWPVRPMPVESVNSVAELKDGLEKFGLDLLIPELSELHTERDEGAAISLTNRSRSAEANSYWMNGYSEEHEYRWTVEARTYSLGWAPKDIEYKGVAVGRTANLNVVSDPDEVAFKRVSIEYVFVLDGARYTVMGYFDYDSMPQDEVAEKKQVLSDDLLCTVKRMIDSRKASTAD